MKIFDIHIGVSDSVRVTAKNPMIKGSVGGKLPNQFDVVRAKKGELDIFCGMMCPVVLKNGKFAQPEKLKSEINEHIKIYEKLHDLKKVTIIKRKNDFTKIGPKIILGLEGMYFLNSDDDLRFLEEIINRGVKIIGPMWNFKNNLFDKKKSRQLVKDFFSICKKNGVIIDLAHSEDNIFVEILDNFDGRVIDSHTNLFSLNRNKRNIRTNEIGWVIQRKGIVGLTFVGEFIGGNRIEDVYRQFETFIKKFGDRNIAIGSDFDGMDNSDLVVNLTDVSEYNNLLKLFVKDKMPISSIKNLAYKNALIFFRNTYEAEE